MYSRIILANKLLDLEGQLVNQYAKSGVRPRNLDKVRRVFDKVFDSAEYQRQVSAFRSDFSAQSKYLVAGKL